MKRQWGLLIVACAVLVLAACGALPGDEGEPTASIQSPATGATVPVNQPVNVQVQANDPDGPGVVRIDLQVDGVTVASFEAGGPQASVAAQMAFTPGAEGAITVSAVAFREDGTSSPASTIALSVVGLTTEPVEETSGEETSSEGESAEEPSASEPSVPASANLDINVRAGPGPGCPIIGVWTQGSNGDLLERTTSLDEYWYKTDYLGEDLPGWVYHDPLALQGDDGELPRVREEGCLYCGDGVCSPEISEVCDECTADCGVCLFCGDGEVNQDSEACDGDASVCGEDYVCTSDCECAEVTPEETPEPECGNGVVEEGEACDGNDEVCDPDGPEGGATGICQDDCTCAALGEPPQAPQCGNGVVEAGEECDGDLAACGGGATACVSCSCVAL